MACPSTLVLLLLLTLFAAAAQTQLEARRHRRRSTDGTSDAAAYEPLAINVLERKAYRHHPVLRAVQLGAYSIDKQFLVELNGLKVPVEYDCDNFNANKHWAASKHFYYYEVPSRWHACHVHQANLHSGLSLHQPALPIVDDEYAEHVAVFQAVLRSKPGQMFVVAELGARWGTWGARAVAMLRAVRGASSNYHALFVESDQGSCDGLRRVMAINNISSYSLDCAKADAQAQMTRFEKFDHVDLLDLDIQGGELGWLQVAEKLVRAKVYRLIVGTHSLRAHSAVQSMFADWILIHEAPKQTGKRCFDVTMRHLRGNYRADSPERFDWGKILESGCYHNTSFGPVVQADGELILDNPAFVRREGAFAMSDARLRVADLL